MAGKYLSLLVHFTWSTAGREPWLETAMRDDLYSYIGGIMNNKNAKLISAGGMFDHIHLYASMPSTISIADFVNAVKSNSSRWIHLGLTCQTVLNCRTFGAQFLFSSFRALTGVAINFRPFGPITRRSLMAENIKCKHCGEKRPALGFAPLPNELGQRIATEICQPCWAGWLQKQTQIINHYGLDLTNPDAQNFLFDNIKGFLFGEALPMAEQQAEIDTSKEGTVKW